MNPDVKHLTPTSYIFCLLSGCGYFMFLIIITFKIFLVPYLIGLQKRAERTPLKPQVYLSQHSCDRVD